MEQETTVRETMAALIDRLHESANVASVYGEAIERSGKTIVPVARVAYGFGGGFGAEDERDEETGESGGVGGGVSATPVGVLEITDEDTRFVRYGQPKKWLGALAFGLGVGLLVGWRRGAR